MENSKDVKICCNTCMFCVACNGVSRCHVSHPQIFNTDYEGDDPPDSDGYADEYMRTRFPIVEGDDWCGEWWNNREKYFKGRV